MTISQEKGWTPGWLMRLEGDLTRVIVHNGQAACAVFRDDLSRCVEAHHDMMAALQAAHVVLAAHGMETAKVAADALVKARGATP